VLGDLERLAEKAEKWLSCVTQPEVVTGLCAAVSRGLRINKETGGRHGENLKLWDEAAKAGANSFTESRNRATGVWNFLPEN